VYIFYSIYIKKPFGNSLPTLIGYVAIFFEFFFCPRLSVGVLDVLAHCIYKSAGILKALLPPADQKKKKKKTGHII
jgi:hypothetical protein